MISLNGSPGIERMSKATAQIHRLPSHEVDGVKIRHHVLDSEAKRLAWLLRRVGQRLRNQITGTRVGAVGSSGDTTTPIVDEHALPDKEWLDYAKWYQMGVLGLLKEQRERARMATAGDAKQLSDEEYRAAMEEMSAQMLREMPTERLAAMIAERERADSSNGDAAHASSTDAASSAAPPFDLSDEEP